jgi:hypothetical protein
VNYTYFDAGLFMSETNLEVYLYPHCDIAKEILLPFQLRDLKINRRAKAKHGKEMARINRRKS